jgi:recombination protein RecR
MLSEDLKQFIQVFSKFPGLGPRSAKRIALYLTKNRNQIIPILMQNLHRILQNHKECSVCGYMDAKDPCFFCTSPHRDGSAICIVAHTGDVWALEKAAFFKGRYHVLGDLISAFQKKRPEELNIQSLQKRLNSEVREIILAMDSTLDGQTTLHYMAQQVRQWDGSLSISTLARGMPVGGALDYVDHGTLMSAFIGRQAVPNFDQVATQWKVIASEGA